MQCHAVCMRCSSTVGTCHNVRAVAAGDITYFDAILSDSRGEPYTLEKAVCMHEEDAGASHRSCASTPLNRMHGARYEA